MKLKLTSVLFMLLGFFSLMAYASPGKIVNAASKHAIPNHYIVVLNDNVALANGNLIAHASPQALDALANQMVSAYGGRLRHTYHTVLHGFSAVLSPQAAMALTHNPKVSWVEQAVEVHGATTQNYPPAGLDRIDQRSRFGDDHYNYDTTASNVSAYIIDSGIRLSHTDFGGRAKADHHQSPAVANMSIQGPKSSAEDTAVRGAISRGVTMVVIAGNYDDDACNYSPARVTEAIVVGAVDSNDQRASFSDYGACVDIFAPGVQITSDTNTSDTATNTGNGTSYAAPFVTGRAALYLAHHPGSSPADVQSNITNYSATNTYIADAGSASPQKIVYTFETLDRPSLQLEYMGCQYGIDSYLVSWNGDYGPESESYDVDQMRSGSWSNFYSGGGRSRTLTVNSSSQFEIRVRYSVSVGTSAFQSSRLMTAPSCDTPPR